MIFHHIFFSFDITKNNLTSKQSTIINNNISLNCSKMEYKFWSLDSAKQFMKVNYLGYYDIFEKLHEKPIVLCDFFRYILMYHFGGIYTDLDFLIIRPFEQFLNLLKSNKISYYPNIIKSPNIILSEEWLDSYDLSETLHNGILISLTKFHPFWLKLIHEIYYDIVIKNSIISAEIDVYNISGPRKLLKFYKENHTFFNDICILPYYYFCPFISYESDNKIIEIKKKILYNNAVIRSTNISSSSDKNWCFFNINDYTELPQLCPNSFFVNVFLNMGSMWK